MKFLSSWQFKDFTAVGVTAALCIVIGILIKMVLGIVISKIPALSSLLLAMVQSIIIALSLMRLPKAGFLTLLGLCMGSIYGFIFPAHPFLFLTFVMAGLAGDLIGHLMGGYAKKTALAASVIIYRLSVIIFGAMLAWWIGFAKTDLAWALILINSAASAMGVVLGIIAAVKLSRELRNAGLIGG